MMARRHGAYYDGILRIICGGKNQNRVVSRSQLNHPAIETSVALVNFFRGSLKHRLLDGEIDTQNVHS